MRLSSRFRIRIFMSSSVCVLIVWACVAIPGCGIVHGTDGQTITLLGFGRITDGQTQTETGVGKGMDGNLSTARDNTFSNRSPAITSIFGEGEK